MSSKNVSVFKFVLFLFFGMIGLWILLALLNNSEYGRMGFGVYFNSGHMGVDWLNPSSWNLNFILLVLLRIFCLLFIISLVIGLIMAAKDYIVSNDKNDKQGLTKSSSTGTTAASDQRFCTKCGKSIGNNWKVCAYCGEEVHNA